jgi:hypothetical protein
MKKTLMCLHVMPHEIEMLENFTTQLKQSIDYLTNDDSFVIKATLNLNPLLIDWNNTSISKQYFIDTFNKLFENIPNINEIRDGEDLLGTTQQKRECIKLDYNQFIFVDTDIVFPKELLKYQLNASYYIKEKMYIISPNIVKMWDNTWDILVHKDYKNHYYGYYKEHNPEITINQPIEEISLRESKNIKFGCGMHTLYSKEFWEFIGVPKSFGGYGPEDTFAMIASTEAIKKNYKITQYVLDNIYISENLMNRYSVFINKLKTIDRKDEFRCKALKNFELELEKFKNKL